MLFNGVMQRCDKGVGITMELYNGECMSSTYLYYKHAVHQQSLRCHRQTQSSGL